MDDRGMIASFCLHAYLLHEASIVDAYKTEFLD